MWLHKFPPKPKIILFNDKRFACESCIKGHRSTKCAHLRKNLTEIKTKGRPNTQCPTCREKRQQKRGHPHHKCQCGSEPPKRFLYHLKLIFDQGLVFDFVETEQSRVKEIQSKVESKSKFTIKVCLDKNLSPDDTIAEMMATELVVDQQETDLELKIFLENPCKCHFGGECICSQRKANASDTGVERDVVLALANMSETPQSEDGKGESECCKGQSNAKSDIVNESGCRCSSSNTGSGCGCGTGCGCSSNEQLGTVSCCS